MTRECRSIKIVNIKSFDKKTLRKQVKKLLISILLTIVTTTTVMAEDVSAYLYGTLKDTPSVKSALKANGFEVVGEYNAMGDPNYHLIAFTNPALKTNASKEMRGFAAVMKVVISKNDNQLIFTNPEYFLSAFLQDDFDKSAATKIKNSLVSAFGTLVGSKDALEDDDIAGYHFMTMQPYYEDMEEIAQGVGLGATLERNAGNNIVFKVVLNKATLYGVAMPTAKGEKSYIETIKGQKNVAFLPYMVLIEDDKAIIMHPKFYLAVSYPTLSMGEFMDISDTPDDIEDYLTELVK